MDSLFAILFNQRSWTKKFSIYIVVFRIVLAYLLFQHAYFKVMGNDLFTPIYLDAFGTGVSKPMAVVLCLEFFCAISLLFGFLIRIFIVPLMFVSLYFVYLGLHLQHYLYSELALLYMMAFIFLQIAGAGRYSIDHLAHHWIKLGTTF